MPGHLQDELLASSARVSVETAFGAVIGRRAANGAVAFLEIPYALPPARFSDPQPLAPSFRYGNKEYIHESKYAAQPNNDGQARGGIFEDKVGYGQPTEDALFLNIICPPTLPEGKKFPVRVYIHGGFLQFGSPHGLSSQAQYICAHRNEVWVNIGYRLSVFGFLANDEPHASLDGNYGFKDQWLALEWVRDHIHSFGGDPEDIQLSGLSAGAHSVHQVLHHASRLPHGICAPFQSAVLQSNAMLTNPKHGSDIREQFHALCTALDLDASSPDILDILRDPVRVPTEKLTHVIETEQLGKHGTFRGVLGGSWWAHASAAAADPMAWQRSGALARALREKGVRRIVLGDLTEEWYLYSIAHDLAPASDGTFAAGMLDDVARYFPRPIVERLMRAYAGWPPPAGTPREEAQALFGRILADGQVHLPVRVLERDLTSAAASEGDMPSLHVVRYEIRWTPEQVRPFGYVTHGTDRPLWAYRLPTLEEDQVPIAEAWLRAVDDAVSGHVGGATELHHPVLTLRADRSIGWDEDTRWDDVMRLLDALPGEGTSASGAS